jgi:putative hydrolase of the HAD superfamily
MKSPAFIFDMSGVLLDFNLETIKNKVSASSDISVSKVERSWRNSKYLQSEIGRISSLSYFQYYSAQIGLTWSYEQWIKEWSQICTYNRHGIRLFNTLKSKFPVFILSNLAEYHKRAVELSFPNFWKVSCQNFLSYEMGLYKPDVQIYLTACAKIGIAPGDCYYFDDDEENVASAKRIGINAFHFCERNISHIYAALSKYELT